MKLMCEAIAALLAVSLLIDAASAQIVTASGSTVTASEAVQQCLGDISAEIIPSSDTVRVFFFTTGAYGDQEADLSILQPADDCALINIPLADYITQLDLVGNCSAVAHDARKLTAQAAADSLLKLMASNGSGRRLLAQTSTVARALDRTVTSKRRLADLLADAGSKQASKKANFLQAGKSLARMLSAGSSSASQQSPSPSSGATIHSNSCSERFNEDIAFHQQQHNLQPSTLSSSISYYYNPDISSGRFPGGLPGLCIVDAAACSDECLDFAPFAESTGLSFDNLCQHAELDLV